MISNEAVGKVFFSSSITLPQPKLGLNLHLFTCGSYYSGGGSVG